MRISKLPKQSALSADEMGHVTQGAALALKARVALYMEHGPNIITKRPAKYLTAAVDASNLVLASNEYALYTDQGLIAINTFYPAR